MTGVDDPSVPAPPRPDMFSNARVVGDQFFLSGMHAGSPSGPIGGSSTYAQAVEAFRRTQALAQACGAHVDDIVVLRIYLTDIADRQAVSRARSAVFTEPFPCSTLVEVSALVDPGLTVEVEAQGFLPKVRSAGD